MENKRIPVEVEWMDAQTWSGQAEEYKEVLEWKPVITHTCGYLIHEDKERVIISFMDFGDGYTKHFQAIPKGMVKKIIRLEPKEQGCGKRFKLNNKYFICGKKYGEVADEETRKKVKDIIAYCKNCKTQSHGGTPNG